MAIGMFSAVLQYRSVARRSVAEMLNGRLVYGQPATRGGTLLDPGRLISTNSRLVISATITLARRAHSVTSTLDTLRFSIYSS
jgi:hypothetical protein